jgi:hypothetical protein
MGKSYIINDIPSELCFIIEQFAMKDQAVYKHRLAGLNTKIPNIDLFPGFGVSENAYGIRQLPPCCHRQIIQRYCKRNVTFEP